MNDRLDTIAIITAMVMLATVLFMCFSVDKATSATGVPDYRATSIKTTSVVFKWTKPSGADHYTIVVKKGSTTVKTVKNVTGTSKKISGLSKNTSYSSHIYPYKKNGTQIAGGYCTFKTKKN